MYRNMYIYIYIHIHMGCSITSYDQPTKTFNRVLDTSRRSLPRLWASARCRHLASRNLSYSPFPLILNPRETMVFF